jgi:hypothetical protein
MSYSLGFLEILIICVVVVLWTWGVKDLLKGRLSLIIKMYSNHQKNKLWSEMP